MKMIELILNGNKVQCEAGITILELAKRYGIQIPTLCHDEELKPYGSCWVCAVEVSGRRGFVTSCGTIVSEGMEIITDSDDIHSARKMALELLISNHYADCEAPCKVACPDHVDIQSYVSLIANGQYHEAVKVIKDTLPMPLSIGRVCPAFCEKECRRQIVEEPIAIRQLKRYAADEDLNDFWSYIPEKDEPKGKKVAIIGAGPSGLTCGYYLSNMGYEVELLESAPQAGGWLRYGIPEYRLPKEILDKEIELMCANGMKIHYGKTLGKDVFLKDLSDSYDAGYLAIGAQKAVPMPVKGSDLTGCYLGVDFLKDHALGNTPPLGSKVAIVGGGNTAIDCARTALRLGAKVSLIYRRTKEEMPADSFEIDAAEHEGIEFHYLCNPVEYMGIDGKLCSVKIETMRLGEPDSSGRRRPEPTGEFFSQDFDSIIAAISQVPEVDTFAEPRNLIDGNSIAISRWQTAIVDENTMFTGAANVFAGGDFRRGAATAIEAIADGRVAALMMDKYLQGVEIVPFKPLFDAKKGQKVRDIDPKEYSIFERIARFKMPELEVGIAKTTFDEVELGFDEEAAKAEADRCLECGCQVNDTCFLRKYCTDYDVDPLRFIGSIGHHPIDYSHPFIARDQNKCVNCGRCIRTCAEIQGAAVLGYIYRGFPTVVAPQFGDSLCDTSCESCGKCINVCPVGALVERNLHYKLNPLDKTKCIQSCGLCGTGCTVEIETQTTTPVRISTPEEVGFNGRNLCFKGRFGWQALQAEDRLRLPMYKEQGVWKAITWDDASNLIKERYATAKSKRFEIHPTITLEEMLLVKESATKAEAKYASGLYKALFSDEFMALKPQSNAYHKLSDYDEIAVLGKISHTLRTLIRLEQRKGKKLVLINPPESDFNRFADVIYHSLDELSVSANRLYVYSINYTTERDALRLWQLAGKSDAGAQNIFVSSEFANYYGMLAMGADSGLCAAVDFALSYGGAPKKADENGFSIAIVTHFDEACNADILLPQPSYQEIEGKALANGAQITSFNNPTRSDAFNRLLKVFYEQGWIHPNVAESNYWNALADAFIRELELAPTLGVDLSKVNIDQCATEPSFIDYGLNKRMTRLYDMRKEKAEF